MTINGSGWKLPSCGDINYVDKEKKKAPAGGETKPIKFPSRKIYDIVVSERDSRSEPDTRRRAPTIKSDGISEQT